MANRRWNKNKKKAVSNGHVAAAPSMSPAPVRKIETMVCHDVSGPNLAMWRNEGWTVVHYQFIDNGSHGLAVVMERLVDVQPVVGVVEQVVESLTETTPNFAETQKVELPVIEVILPEPVAVSSLLDKLKEKAPILAAIDEYGVDAVKDAMDTDVIEAGQRGFNNAMLALGEPIETKRFESRLLSAGKVNPDTILQENLVPEVVLS